MSRLQDVIQRGTNAAQPAATTVSAGTLYAKSDRGYIQRSTGSAWEDFGPANPEVRAAFTPPVNSDFAWVNQGTSTITDDTDSVVLTGAASGSGVNIVARVKTAPAAPYVITAFLSPMILNKQYNGYGMCFRQSSDGKMHVFHVLCNGVTETPYLISTKYPGPTSAATDYQILYVADFPRWWRIADNNTNRIVSISADGVNWVQIHSVTRTDHITANQVGFCISTENAVTPNIAPIVRLSSWAQS